MNLVPVFSHPDAQPVSGASVDCVETPMRLTLNAFGVELDVTLGREQATDDNEPAWVDCGTTGSTPVGFVRSQLPEWEVPGSYHQFDPEPDSEDT